MPDGGTFFMTESRKAKVFAIISGALFMSLADIYIASRLIVVTQQKSLASVFWYDLFYVAFYISAGVLLFLRKRNFGLLIPFGMNLLVELYALVKNFSVIVFVFFICWLAVFVMVLLTAVLKTGRIAGKILCFSFPVLLTGVRFVEWASLLPYIGRVETMAYFIANFMTTVMSILAIIFMGLWLTEPMVMPENTAEYSEC